MLNRLSVLSFFLFLFSFLVSCQKFNSGIVRLFPLSQFDVGTYSLRYNCDTNDLVIAISSFTVLRSRTVCQISSKGADGANISCTGNVGVLAYLFFERTPMIYANRFSYYWFQGNQKIWALWEVQRNVTAVQYPQLRAVLSGFSISAAANTMIEIKSMQDGWSANISRTLNVQVVHFFYILIQNYSPYNLTFVDLSVSKFSRDLSLTGVRVNYLNFWGIQALKSSGLGFGQNVSLSIHMSSSLTSGNNVLGIESFELFGDAAIDGLFMVDNLNVSLLSCGRFYFDPLLRTCLSNCTGSVLIWNTSFSSYRYCLRNRSEFGPIPVYIDSNKNDLWEYVEEGCAYPTLNEDGSIICQYCKAGYRKYDGHCHCDWGYFQGNASCSICLEGECLIRPVVSGRLLASAEERSIELVVNLPRNEEYLHYCEDAFSINVTVNGVLYSGKASFKEQLMAVTILVLGIKESNKYDIVIEGNGAESGQLFLIDKNGQFLWVLNEKLSLAAPMTTAKVVEAMAPVFADSDKSVPVILVIAFVLGDKINTFSIFQTVSLIYLINFMAIGEHFNSLREVLSKIFIFQPKPLFRLMGSQDAWITVPAMDETKVGYNQLIYNYTKGELFIGLSLNNLLTMALQISLIVGVIKLAKRCLGQSENRVAPYVCAPVLDLSRSRVDDRGFVRWLSEPLVRSAASVRFKLFMYFKVLDQRKWVVITSLWTMQLLGMSFLLIYELMLPMLGMWAIISRVCCFCCLLVIVVYPLCLVNYEPLYVLKCLSVCYKRREYKRWELWMSFYFVYLENVGYALIVLSCQGATTQLASIVGVQLVKLIYFRKKLKKIEFLRVGSLVIFFTAMLVGCVLPSTMAASMTQVIVGALLGVLAVQVLKLVRGVIIVLLNLFRNKVEEAQSEKAKPKEESGGINTVLAYFDSKQKLKKDEKIKKSPPLLPQQQAENKENKQVCPVLGRSVKPSYKSRAFRRALGERN